MRAHTLVATQRNGHDGSHENAILVLTTTRLLVNAGRARSVSIQLMDVNAFLVFRVPTQKVRQQQVACSVTRASGRVKQEAPLVLIAPLEQGGTQRTMGA